MRPTFSIIFFTVLSGAGYGLWFLLGLGLAFDWPACHAAATPGDLPAVRLCFYAPVIHMALLVGFVAGQHRTLVFGRASRQAVARMARAVAMAKLVAFARRRRSHC